MGFATLIFWLGFALYFFIYWTVLNKPGRLKLRNGSLLVVSYIFYASWDWRFLGIILASSTIDYFVSILLVEKRTVNVRKWLLFLSVFANLFFLALFKYHNFFIESANALLNGVGIDHTFLHLNWVLPVGISFYTFQTMSYTIDVYKNRIQPSRDPLIYYTYVAFFPQLLAGPIERAKDLVPQFEKIHAFELTASKQALLRILWGAFKKVVVADRLAVFVNVAYANPEQLSTVSTIITVIFFVIQLYCDFSGYCDMAIGSARLLGFKLSENFTRPLLSKNIKTVYQRWHITIHTWFRDYVYFALPRPKSKLMVRWNVLIVFALAGLWHGSGINFLLWGIINAALILILDPIIDRATASRFTPFIFLTRFIGHAAVYLSLIFFRSPDIQYARQIFGSLFNWQWNPNGWNGFMELLQFGLGYNEIYFGFLFISIIFIIEIIQENYLDRVQRFYSGPGLSRWTAAITLSLFILFFGFYNGRTGSGNYRLDDGVKSQFIYEQF